MGHFFFIFGTYRIRKLKSRPGVIKFRDKGATLECWLKLVVGLQTDTQNRINSLVPPVWLDTHTMGFTIKRKKMAIEKINLPPEDTRSGATEQQPTTQQQHSHPHPPRASPATGLMCAPGPNKTSALDF